MLVQYITLDGLVAVVYDPATLSYKAYSIVPGVSAARWEPIIGSTREHYRDAVSFVEFGA